MTSRLTPSRFSCEDDPSECLALLSTSWRGERGDTSVFLLEGEGEESGVADPDALCAPVTLCGTCRFRFNSDALFSSCFVRGAEVFAVLLLESKAYTYRHCLSKRHLHVAVNVATIRVSWSAQRAAF